MKRPFHLPETSGAQILRYCGLHAGSVRAAASAMPRPAILSLIHEAQERGCCIAVVLADFYAKHHGGGE